MRVDSAMRQFVLSLGEMELINWIETGTKADYGELEPVPEPWRGEVKGLLVELVTNGEATDPVRAFLTGHMMRSTGESVLAALRRWVHASRCKRQAETWLQREKDKLATIQQEYTSWGRYAPWGINHLPDNATDRQKCERRAAFGARMAKESAALEQRKLEVLADLLIGRSLPGEQPKPAPEPIRSERPQEDHGGAVYMTHRGVPVMAGDAV